MNKVGLFFLNQACSIFLGELWQFIQDAVATYQQSDLTGEQKKAAVKLDAYTHALNAGKEVSASLIGLGIKAALVKAGL